MTSRFAPNQHPRHAQQVGKSRAGDDYGTPERGSVANTGRWFSIRWWMGHHWRRRPGSGEFAEGEQRFAQAPPELLQGRRGGRETSRLAVEHKAYLESQYDAADRATRGHLVNAAGERRGISARRTWFSGRVGSLAYASDELRDHFAANGRPLSASEYRAQQRGPEYTITTRGGREMKASIVRRRQRAA